MGARFFLLAIFFFAFMKLSAQIDGVHLSMRMHPVQILSVGSGDDIRRNAAEDYGQNFITVSSTSGFEVNMYRRMNEDEILNVVNSNRGAVQKSYTIDENISRLIREFEKNPSAASDNLVLTLISR